jgi:hypothetical protein
MCASSGRSAPYASQGATKIYRRFSEVRLPDLAQQGPPQARGSLLSAFASRLRGRDRDVGALGDILPRGTEDALLGVQSEGGLEDALSRLFDGRFSLVHGVLARGQYPPFY